ncbi:HAD-IA family hydrolase [Patescibacteria group bacterium]|nr:HAD-IA family hydrolase [Patescibacteria group bacterium]
MKFKNIIFDFDGVLIDSRPGVVEAFQKMMEELSSKKIENQEIVNLIGKPLAEIVGLILKTDSKEIIFKGSESFKKNYQNNCLFNNFVYPGIKEMLERLKNEPYRLFVVSNKIELFIKKILNQHKIENYFIAARGTDGSDAKSRKQDYLKKLIDDYNLKKEESVIIGDTISDIAAGKENNIYCIGVTWGYGSEESLIKADADVVCCNPNKILKIIKNND